MESNIYLGFIESIKHLSNTTKEKVTTLGLGENFENFFSDLEKNPGTYALASSLLFLQAFSQLLDEEEGPQKIQHWNVGQLKHFILLLSKSELSVEQMKNLIQKPWFTKPTVSEGWTDRFGHQPFPKEFTHFLSQENFNEEVVLYQVKKMDLILQHSCKRNREQSSFFHGPKDLQDKMSRIDVDPRLLDSPLWFLIAKHHAKGIEHVNQAGQTCNFSEDSESFRLLLQESIPQARKNSFLASCDNEGFLRGVICSVGFNIASIALSIAAAVRRETYLLKIGGLFLAIGLFYSFLCILVNETNPDLKALKTALKTHTPTTTPAPAPTQ